MDKNNHINNSNYRDLVGHLNYIFFFKYNYQLLVI